MPKSNAPERLSTSTRRSTVHTVLKTGYPLAHNPNPS